MSPYLPLTVAVFPLSGRGSERKGRRRSCARRMSPVSRSNCIHYSKEIITYQFMLDLCPEHFIVRVPGYCPMLPWFLTSTSSRSAKAQRQCRVLGHWQGSLAAVDVGVLGLEPEPSEATPRLLQGAFGTFRDCHT